MTFRCMFGSVPCAMFYFSGRFFIITACLSILFHMTHVRIQCLKRVYHEGQMDHRMPYTQHRYEDWLTEKDPECTGERQCTEKVRELHHCT